MYVATFYSYKGGVGRTLALLNVAYEMADTGLKVLVVDFDLEAPAIHADRWKSRGAGIAAATAASSDHAGMVEYVGTYLDTGQAPLVADYVVDATPDECAGEIGLMPAGRINDSYGDRLNQIDWNALYADHDGYLMFEDLRAQWETLGFHYVLVDSRTGFTDVGGICTRHLPDAVSRCFAQTTRVCGVSVVWFSPSATRKRLRDGSMRSTCISSWHRSPPPTTRMGS